MESFVPVLYEKQFEPMLFSFLETCLPESGRTLDLDGRHSYYREILEHFLAFWCMFDGESVIGTVAVRELRENCCELKSLYLLKKYHGKRLGRALIETAIRFAGQSGYQKMYLDSMSHNTNAIALYRKTGFTDTARYNDNRYSDVFMVREL